MIGRTVTAGAGLAVAFALAGPAAAFADTCVDVPDVDAAASVNHEGVNVHAGVGDSVDVKTVLHDVL